MNHIEDKCRYCNCRNYNKNTVLKESYETMLEETFNIKIPYFPRISVASKLICENCISRLRDASDFKNMVIASEEKFLKYFEKLNYLDGWKVNILETNIEEVKKAENILKTSENSSQNEEIDNMNHDCDSIYEDVVKPENHVEGIIKRKCKIEGTLKRKRKRIVLDDIQVTGVDESRKRISERRGRSSILRENSLKLIANSTMIIFQWHRSRYTCYCCKQPFTDLTMLKEHTDTKHSLKNLETTIIKQLNRLLKVDISSLNCRKCKTKLNTISDLRQHLSEKHNMKFDIADDLLVPYKIQSDGLKCQICSENFSTFRLLNMHMNRHYQNHVCDICGATFANLNFLTLHKLRLHKTFVCRECDVTFTRRRHKINHDIKEHNFKFVRKPKFACQYCDERFFREDFKIQHLVKKHGMSKPEHKCTSCDKLFITIGMRNNHFKKVHMKEKKHKCDICPKLFYSTSDVKRHRVTHTGEKKFICSLCSSQFTTKDSIRRHIRKFHILN